MRYWITRYVENTTDASRPTWVLPEGAVGAVSVYPVHNPGMRRIFAALDDAAPDPPDGIHLADDLNGTIRPLDLNQVRNALSISSFDASTPIDVLWEIVTVHADPEGLTHVKPLLPTQRGDMELHLKGHSRVKVERYDPAAHPRVLELERLEFARIRANMPERKARQILGALERKYRGHGVTAADIDATLEPLPPETVIGDTFTDTDGTALTAHTATGTNGGHAWQDFYNAAIDLAIQSNRIHYNAGDSLDFQYARAEADLSSADHYAQLVVHTIDTSGIRIGPAARFQTDDTTTRTCYYASLRGNDTVELEKIVDGGSEGTEIASTGVTLSLPDTVKVEIDGSTLRSYFNGALLDEVTDMDITGYVRAGMQCRENTGDNGADAVGDDWQAEDLGAAAITVTPSLVSVTASVLAPTASGSGAATVAPSLVSITASVFAPSVAATGSATVAPALVAVSSTVLAPTVSGTGAASVTPSLTSAAASVLSPTVEATGAATVAPALVSASATVLAPSVTVGATFVTPSLVSVAASVLAPTVSGSGTATVQPSLVPVTATVFAPTVTSSASELPVTSGLVLDLDATKLSLNDGDPVSTWEDASSAGNDATQGTAASQPVYRTGEFDAGSKPAVEFDGSDDYLVLPAAVVTGLDSVEIFYVLRQTGDGMMLMSDAPATDSLLFRRRSMGDDFRLFIGGSDAGVSFGTAWDDGSPHMVGGRYDHNAGEIYTRVDGEADSQNLAAALGALNLSGSPVNVGRDTRDGVYVTGSIAEIAVYNRVLSTSERDQVEQHLSAKWLAQTVTPNLVTATSAVFAPAASGSGAAVVTPSLVTATASVLAPTVSGTGAASVTPALTTAAASVLAPTISVGAIFVTPSLVTATVGVLAPTVSGSGSATATPSLVTATSAVLPPTVAPTGSANVAPALVVAATLVFTPTVQGVGTATPVTPALVIVAATVFAAVVTVKPLLGTGHIALSNELVGGITISDERVGGISTGDGI